MAVSLFLLFFIIFYVYFKINSPKYSAKEIFDKYSIPAKKTDEIERAPEYTKEEKQILDSSPKYSREEIIQKYNLQVKTENDVVLQNTVLKSQVSPSITIKKPKEIPKQNVSHKNYANVFKTINQDIQENKIQSLEIKKEDTLKVLPKESKGVVEEDTLEKNNSV